MKIKLCGIRREEDIQYVNEFLPDYIGFVFAESRRRVTSRQAEILKSRLDVKIKAVGVFVNEPINSIAIYKNAADIIQLHGDEDESYIVELKEIFPDKEIWKAVRVRTAEDIAKAQMLPVDKLLLDSFSKDSYGGTGKTADWSVIKNTIITKPFFLAGGLNADNIEQAVLEVKPFGVDISGGIETDGFKDKNKINEIMTILRKGN